MGHFLHQLGLPSAAVGSKGFYGANAPPPPPVPPPTLDAIIDLAFITATQIVGVTAGGNCALSGDAGGTTTPVFNPVPTINAYQMVTAGNGVAVAIGTSASTGRHRLVRTGDFGHTWKDTTPDNTTPPMADCGGLVFSPLAGNLFIAFDAGNRGVIFTSSDGVTWTANVVAFGSAPFPGPFTTSQYVETTGVGAALYCGDKGNIGRAVQRTTDGINWTTALNVTEVSTNGPALNGSVLGVIVPNVTPGVNKFYTSPDAVTWTPVSQTSNPFTTPPYLQCTCAVAGDFITAIKNDQLTFATSADGITWVDRTVPTANFSAGGATAALGSRLYLYQGGIVHTNDLINYVQDFDNGSTVNNLKTFGLHAAGCGSTFLGGRFFPLA